MNEETTLHSYLNLNNKEKNKDRLNKLSDIQLVIFDIDKTLVYPIDPHFYSQHSRAVELAIAKHRQIDLDEAKKIANEYRTKFGGGEFALFSPNETSDCEPDFKILHQLISEIDPVNNFLPDDEVITILKTLKENGIILVALTNTVESLAKDCLLRSGIYPDNIFNQFIGYREETGPPKTIFKQAIFLQILDYFDIEAKNALSVGDSLRHDIIPAASIGINTCHINAQPIDNYEGHYIKHIRNLLTILQLKNDSE